MTHLRFYMALASMLPLASLSYYLGFRSGQRHGKRQALSTKSAFAGAGAEGKQSQ